MRELLTRRLGPLQVWVWFVLFVIGLVIFLRYRASKQPAPSSNAGNVFNSPNLTTAPSTLIPYSSQVFVNVQQPTTGTSGGPPMPGGGRTRPPGSGIPGWPGPGRHPNPEWPPPNTPPPAQPPPAQPPPVVQQPPPRRESITYSVVSGDTLTRIANLFGLDWNAIYAANQATIEAIAQQHGFSSSGGGHWIFPGEQLLIPT